MKAIKSIRRAISNPAKLLSVSHVRAAETVLHEGFLRKKSHSMMAMARSVMHMKWGMFYVLVTTKSIYYFKSETSTSLVGKLSLFGYNVIKRVHAPQGSSSVWPEFSFMLQHASVDPNLGRNHIFAATNLIEFKTWMVEIRNAMVAANRQMLAGISMVDIRSSSNISLVEEPIYPSENYMPPSSANRDDAICESDDSDYAQIDDPVEPPPRPKKPHLPIPPSTDSYIDIPDDITAPFQSPPHFSPPAKLLLSPNSSRSHENPFAAELNSRIGKNKKVGVTSAMPVAFAPTAPKPPIGVKPTLHVKPRMQGEGMYWNGAREDAARRMRSLPLGMFCVRAGQTSEVLVISAGPDDPPHSLRVIKYSDGTMGLKSEATASNEERFTSTSALVNFYKVNDIHLRNGMVSIRLTSSPEECDTELT